MIGKEDVFYAFFAGIASFLSAFILIFLAVPSYFQSDPSVFSITIVIAMEIVVFFSFFLVMRRKH
jgi:hypothetical protein